MSLVAEGIGVTLGGRAVLRDVSVALAGGSLVGVLGPNGAGKSTLLRALLGLLPATGRILLDGEPLATFARARIARRIAYLPQGQTLHWPLSVERLVALGRLPHLGPFSRIGADDRNAIAAAMRAAEVDGLATRDATELSGGERARVLLARALAVGAPALIVDEPLASLDPAHQIHGMELLRREADRGGLVLAALHDLTLAMRFCDRVLVLKDGTLLAAGPPRDVLNPGVLADAYGITALAGDADFPYLVPRDRLTKA